MNLRPAGLYSELQANLGYMIRSDSKNKKTTGGPSRVEDTLGWSEA